MIQGELQLNLNFTRTFCFGSQSSLAMASNLNLRETALTSASTKSYERHHHYLSLTANREVTAVGTIDFWQELSSRKQDYG